MTEKLEKRVDNEFFRRGLGSKAWIRAKKNAFENDKVASTLKVHDPEMAVKAKAQYGMFYLGED